MLILQLRAAALARGALINLQLSGLFVLAYVNWLTISLLLVINLSKVPIILFAVTKIRCEFIPSNPGNFYCQCHSRLPLSGGGSIRSLQQVAPANRIHWLEMQILLQLTLSTAPTPVIASVIAARWGTPNH